MNDEPLDVTQQLADRYQGPSLRLPAGLPGSGRSSGAWGGDDIFRCDSCPDWQTGEWPPVEQDSWKEAIAHARTHGFDVEPGRSTEGRST